MKQRLLRLFPSEFRHDPAHFQGLGLASVYTVLAVLQLFTFEDFRNVTTAYSLPGGEMSATVLALLLPLAEIAALPYLLSMILLGWMRKISRISVLVAAAIWVMIALWTNLTGNNTYNVGIFGETLQTPNQWWFVIFVALLAWAAWLMYRAIPVRKG